MFGVFEGGVEANWDGDESMIEGPFETETEAVAAMVDRGYPAEGVSGRYHWVEVKEAYDED